MQIYAIYMQKYANICSTVCATEICKNMQKYAKYMHAICKNMQNMQSRFLYAEYAKICTPHFADGVVTGTVIVTLAVMFRAIASAEHFFKHFRLDLKINKIF